MGVGCNVNYYVRVKIFTRKDIEFLTFRCPTMQVFCCILLHIHPARLSVLKWRLEQMNPPYAFEALGGRWAPTLTRSMPGILFKC
jgi:hypothetical protein